MLAVMSLFLGVAQAGDAVTMVAGAGGAPSVVITPADKGLRMPACRAVVWEAFQELTASYVPLPQQACGPTAAAVALDAPLNSALAEVPPGVQVVRAVVTVGKGCKADLPLELAGCREVVAVEGPTISVRQTESP